MTNYHQNIRLMHKITNIPLIALTLALALAAAPLTAQTDGGAIDAILRQVESNNRQLQAARQLNAAQKTAYRTENNLPDPTVSYAHLWDSDDKNITAGELVVTQSFDFPTLYATRNKLNRHRNAALDAQAEITRQDILLQAKEACMDIVMLQQMQQLLEERLHNAEELAALYRQRLETGDANRIETNKINLEMLNVRTELRTNRAALEGKKRELRALNGGMPLDTMPDTYPLDPLPADFASLCPALLSADPSLQALKSTAQAARRQIAASKQGWLPSLEIGYRRNTETRHPLNGIVVGFSIPLFQNRGKVKAAKSEALNAGFLQQEAETQTTSDLWQRYTEARELQHSIAEYREAFTSQQDMTLLRKALDEGQMSMIEYFLEVSVLHQTLSNLLQLENQYHKAVARIYKSRL